MTTDGAGRLCDVCAQPATESVGGGDLCSIHATLVRRITRDANSGDAARVELAGRALILGRYPHETD